jgi:hypothetical protein
MKSTSLSQPPNLRILAPSYDFAEDSLVNRIQLVLRPSRGQKENVRLRLRIIKGQLKRM